MYTCIAVAGNGGSAGGGWCMLGVIMPPGGLTAAVPATTAAVPAPDGAWLTADDDSDAPVPAEKHTHTHTHTSVVGSNSLLQVNLC